MLSSIGPMELIVVLAIALIILGPKRLPEAGKSLGRGLREFKGAISNNNDHDDASAAPELPGMTAASESVAAPRRSDPVA
jgi:sec-independent protein translocase protein TatA